MSIGLASPFPVKGVGRPDDTKEISLGQIRPGISLKYNQRLVIFGYTPTDAVVHPYVIPWVQPMMAPGALAHLINVSTGLPLPYTVPAGYTATLIEQAYNFSEDSEQLLLFDGFLIGCPAYTAGGHPVSFTQVVANSSATFDPLALLPHTFDWEIINRGGGNMKGGITISILLTAIGTPPFPTTKDTQCPFCGHKQTVPAGTTDIICAVCGKLYRVWALEKYRGT